MDLSPYIQSLRDDLLTAASVGDEQARRAATMLATAIEPATRLAIMNALSDLAAEITGALQDTTVDIRLDGRDVRVNVARHGQSPERASDSSPFASSHASSYASDAYPTDSSTTPEDLRRAVQDAGGELSRTTVRLFNELKTQAERAASDQGVSLNTYISRAVSDSVRNAVPGKGQHRGRPAGGRTVNGYVRG
jgi:HicB family